MVIMKIFRVYIGDFCSFDNNFSKEKTALKVF